MDNSHCPSFAAYFDHRIAFCIFCVNFSTYHCEKTCTFAGGLKEHLEILITLKTDIPIYET